MIHFTNDADPGGVQAQEDANTRRCYEAAAAHGLTPQQADECDGCDKGCPLCPFMRPETIEEKSRRWAWPDGRPDL